MIGRIANIGLCAPQKQERWPNLRQDTPQVLDFTTIEAWNYNAIFRASLEVCCRLITRKRWVRPRVNVHFLGFGGRQGHRVRVLLRWDVTQIMLDYSFESARIKESVTRYPAQFGRCFFGRGPRVSPSWQKGDAML